MALTDPKIRQAKPKDKAYRLADEKGLYLEVHPNGSRYWRHKYRFNKKEKRMAYGVYPDVSLKDAREKRETIAESMTPEQIAEAQRLAREWWESHENESP